MEIKELLLREIGKFKNNKIIFSNYHVSTDNMNKHNQPIFYSKKGNLYEKTNILMSNIRPYFNKVWYSDRTGSKSSNVLCFVVTNNNVLSKYAYYLICSDKFNNFWSKTSKGTTMPVGDKEAILNFKFKICDKATQQKIINIIEPFENLKNKINNKLHYLKDITLICINNFNLNKKFSLNNFVNFQGFSFKSNDFMPNNGKYIIYKISNITNSKQNTSYTNNLISSCLLREGDVVTGLSGTIGTSDVILENDKFLLNQRLLAIKTNYPLLIKLIIENNKNILEKKSTGSVQMNITKNDVLNIKYDSNLNNVFNNLISKLYINYSKKILLINNAIKLLIDLYIF